MIQLENIVIPDQELEFSFSRSSGPGGQNVNKVNSKVTLRWNVRLSKSLTSAVLSRFEKKYQNRISQEGEIVIQSDRYRDQPKNIQDCQEKLRLMLVEVLHPPKKRIPSKPSTAQKEKRLKNKKEKAEKKERRNWKWD